MKYDLTKIFVAVYKDNTYFQQPLNDTSAKDPKKSAYFDVDHSKLKAFFLSDENCACLVNLEDGHFEVNGVPFFMHNIPLKVVGAENLDALQGFELIYFRQVDQHINLGDGGTSVDVVYQIGWQAKDGHGNIHKRVMELK